MFSVKILFELGVEYSEEATPQGGILAVLDGGEKDIGQDDRLENPGKLPLEMIEVQSGSYLGEDDIVRFEDRYGR